MARQGGRVQLEQSDIRLAWNMAKTNGGFSCATMKEMQYLINKPRAEVREETMRWVEFPWHKTVKAVIEKQTARIRPNHPDGCLHCQNGPAKNLQTCWRRIGTGASPPDRRSQPTAEPTPPLPRMPPAPPGNDARAQRWQIVNLPAGYVYSHTSLPCTDMFTLDAYAQDSQHDTDLDPDMLTDEGTSSG